MSAQLVAPEVLHDSVQPAIQPRAWLPRVRMAQRTLNRCLHYVLRVGVRPRQHGRETTQPRQQFYELAPELRHVFEPVSDRQRLRRKIIPSRRIFL
jgi:hypothetical protein